MIRTVSLAATLALAATTFAYADDDDGDDKLPAGVVEKVEEVLSTLGCKGYEEVEVEDNGTIEIEDAVCSYGKMDIKLYKDGKMLLMSADKVTLTRPNHRGEISASPKHENAEGGPTSGPPFFLP